MRGVAWSIIDIVIVIVVVVATSAGCLRQTQFQCAVNGDCGAGGNCETTGFCSFLNERVCGANGRLYSESAGQLANTCVNGSDPGLDGGVDTPDEGGPGPGCPGQYAAVNGSPHLYTRLTNTSWDDAAAACRATSGSAYLAVPDDAVELVNLAAVPAVSLPFWIGIDDKTTENTFVRQSDGGIATFLPWAQSEPDNNPGDQDCVNAISSSQIATEKCGTRQDAVCECEP